MNQASEQAELKIARFRVDVTPPVGDPICGGWLPPSVAIADPLSAFGVVLFGNNCAPVVLCVIDWCEIANQTHMDWCNDLAGAVGTSADRVALHTLHPHCTPWPDGVAQSLLEQQSNAPHMVNMPWCQSSMQRVVDAARQAMHDAQPLTHITIGQALVEQVASNRRIIGSDGKCRAMRATRCTDPAIRAEPEGLIDPWLKSIGFWNGSTKLAVLSYYAVHATTNDSNRTVTPDFPGIARNRRAADEPGVLHASFNGCAGNIGAGKYNDGSPGNLPILADRLYRAMVIAEQNAVRVAVSSFDWQSTEIVLPARTDISDADLRHILQSTDTAARSRIHSAMQLSYRSRINQPIRIGRLSFHNAAHLLHLPGESFIEYQLFAQSLRADAWVAVPSYGDCGPGYICLERSYDEGGYEPVDSFVSPECESILRSAIRQLLDSHA